MDEEAYKRDVLDAARKDGPPDDLWVRYGLTESVVMDNRLAGHIADVLQIWKKNNRLIAYKDVVSAFETQHVTLVDSGRLTVAALQGARRARRKSAGVELDSVSAGNDAILTESFRRLYQKYRGALSEAELRAELAKRAVSVVDAIDLPTDPPDKSVTGLQRSLRVLGKTLSIDILFDADGEGAVRHPFTVLVSLTGLSLEALTAATDREGPRPYDNRKAAFGSVAAILKGLSFPGGWQALILWELVRMGRAELAPGVTTQRILATRLATTGLDRSEASTIAASLLTSSASGPSPETLVDDALAQGELRRAQTLAGSLPAGDERHERIRSLAARVDRLVTDAQLCLASGDSEAAISMLNEASTIAHDDEALAERLHRIPPPAPVRVTAVSNGAAVAIRWGASPIRVGTVAYRVVRRLGEAPTSFDGGVVVADTDATEVTDRDTIKGEPLAYAVFARRNDAWSVAAPAPVIVCAPDVDELRADADENSVTLQWKIDPAAKRVAIARRAGESAWLPQIDDETRSTSLRRHVDRGVRRGARYAYRVSAVYMTNRGEEIASRGVVTEVTPDASGGAIRDLHVTVEQIDDTPVAAASWTPPGAGQVILFVSPRRVDWSPGEQVALTSLTNGRAAPGEPTIGSDGRARTTFRLDSGRQWVTAVTANGSEAVIGNSVRATCLDPVTRLTAERLNDEIRLAWVWPTAGNHARIRWWPQSDPGLITDVALSRGDYVEHGGCRLTAVWAPVVVEVIAMIDEAGTESGPAVRLLVDAPKWLRYNIERSGRWGRQRRFAFSVDESLRVPAISIVHHDTKVQPQSAEGGEVLRRIDSRVLTPNEPVYFDVTPPHRGGWNMCFFAEAHDGIVMIHPPVSRLRL